MYPQGNRQTCQSGLEVFFWKDSVQECYLLKVRVTQRDAARTGAGGAWIIGAQAEKNCLGSEMIL